MNVDLPSSSTAPAPSGRALRLRKLFRAGAVLTLLCAPSGFAWEFRPGWHLAPADVLLALTAAFWLAGCIAERDWRGIFRSLHWPELLFVGLAGASILLADERPPPEGARMLARLAECFLLGTAVFDAFLRGGGRTARRWALGLSCAVFAAVTVLAVFQYAQNSDTPLTVRGTFANRNVLGGYFALALPLVFSGVFAVRVRPVRVLLAVLAGAALGVTLSGAAFAALFAALLGLAACAGWRVFLPVAGVLAFLQIWVWPELPRENDLAHFYSVSLYDEDYELGRRYPEWQAAYNLALTVPETGVGLGNYDRQVGKYYERMPRREGPGEPDTRNFYLFLLASCGVPAVAAFLAVLAAGAGAAGRAACRAGGDREAAWLAGGAAAGLAAFAVVCAWHPLPLARGIGLPLAFLLALARRWGDEAKPAAAGAGDAAGAGAPALAPAVGRGEGVFPGPRSARRGEMTKRNKEGKEEGK